MKRYLISGAALLVLAVGLSACGGGGGGGSATVTPPPASASVADQLGTGFGTDFRASPNSDPRDLAAGDVIAVNPTAEPIPLAGS
ncbi:hypothetical protein BH10PSE5_BH10PSE5_12080 [soil metagenome]